MARNPAKSEKAEKIDKMDKSEKENQAQKEKALTQALSEIGKRFGTDSIRRLGDKTIEPIEVIPTGSLSLDAALGVGGLPKGRVIEIFGPESSGKTTLALHAVANCQKAGGSAAFIDAEHALDPLYARKLGVDTEGLLVSQPDCGEQALEIVDLLVRSNAVDIIVIDSVAALVPRSEIEGEMGDSSVGVQARLMSQALRKLTGVVKKSNVCIIFINQIRMKIGVVYGSPETTPGGNALKFYSSVRLDVRRTGAVKSGEDNIGNEVRVKVVKNKVAAPFRQATFNILFSQGISYNGDLLTVGQDMGVVEKTGAWLSFGETRLGCGMEKACLFLKENPEILKTLDAAVREKLFAADAPVAVPSEAKDKSAEDEAAA